MTYIDTLEEVAAEVAEWAVEVVQSIIDAVSPDGRAFDTVRLGISEQVSEYLQLRGDPQAWEMWVADNEMAITQNLLMGGVPEEQIAMVNPRAIALSFAYRYSGEMERKLEGQLNGSGNGNNSQ